MIILKLIVNISCISVIIYMHYHVSNHSFTELVWWFCFMIFRKLFCNMTVTWSYATQFWQFEMFVLKFQLENVGQSKPTTAHVVQKNSGICFCILFLVDYEGWMFTAVCSVWWLVIVQLFGIFAEIYCIVSNLFFQCFSSQYMVTLYMLCSTNVFYQIIKMTVYYRIFSSVYYWINEQTKYIYIQYMHYSWPFSNLVGICICISRLNDRHLLV